MFGLRGLQHRRCPCVRCRPRDRRCRFCPSRLDAGIDSGAIGMLLNISRCEPAPVEKRSKKGSWKILPVRRNCRRRRRLPGPAHEPIQASVCRHCRWWQTGGHLFPGLRLPSFTPAREHPSPSERHAASAFKVVPVGYPPELIEIRAQASRMSRRCAVASTAGGL